MDLSYYEMYLSKELFPKDTRVKDVFYYDESNNVRKLVLRKGELNNDISKAYFVLGGLAIPKDATPNISMLVKKLNFPQETKEFKISNFVGRKKNIDSVLKSKKVRILLDWLLEEKLYIHYFAQNLLFFSLVDLVDSLPYDEASENALFMFYRPLKNALYTEVLKDLDSYLEILFEFGYPNIRKDSITSFIKKLYELYFNNYEGHDNIEDFPKELLRQMMKSAISNESLVFLEDNEDFVLIDKFHMTYMNQMLRFPSATHIFDNEYEIEKKIIIEQKDLVDYVSYKFVDSKSELLIQLSDVIVGVMSEILSFIEYKSIFNIKEYIDGLDMSKLELIYRLNKLIMESDKKSILTLCFIGSDESIEKINYFYGYSSKRYKLLQSRKNF